jgi:glycosyltransferase involved in cell wall biosynthesis
MISVVIGTYNRAQMVSEAIQAALAQTEPEDEIVVSNDASSDATRAVLQVIAERHPAVRVFHQERNSGGVANWNFAIAQTRGDYIALCSDDDQFSPGHLKSSLEYLRAHPRIGLVHSSFVDLIEMPDSRVMAPRPLRAAGPLIVDRRNLLPYLIRYYDWPFHPSTIVMRREVWNRVGPFDVTFGLTDTDWFVRAAELFPVTMLPRHGVVNRRHAGNWSNRMGSARMQREIFQIVERFILRRWTRGLRRTAWQAAWRANVRLRLLLTLRARIKTGHVKAAASSWEALCQGTGRSVPAAIQRAGEDILRAWSLRRSLRPPESVSPL